jgi:hypothetical protein
VRVAEQVLSRDLGGETVLLDLRSGVYFSLEEVGARIWGLLAEGRTLGETLRCLLAEYDVTEARCASDLVTFVAQLRARGLVEVDDPASP